MVYGERKYNLLCRVVAYYPTSLDGRFIVELSHMAEKGVRRQLSMDTRSGFLVLRLRDGHEMAFLVAMLVLSWRVMALYWATMAQELRVCCWAC